MKVVVIFYLALFSNVTFAQNHDYIWLTGYPESFTTIDFNNNMHSSISTGAISLTFANSSISNSAGNLEFYSNGCSVANAQFEIMPGGHPMNQGFVCNFFDNPAQGTGLAQSLLTLPLPDSESIYYIFHQNVDTMQIPEVELEVRSLHYSIVHMEEDDGKGSVTTVGEVIVEDILWGELICNFAK